MSETGSKVQEPAEGENRQVLISPVGSDHKSAFQTLMQGAKGAKKSGADLSGHTGGGTSEN